MGNNQRPVPEITKRDWELMNYLDRFRVLTVKQIAALSQRSHQVVRRRLRILINHDLVSVRHRAYGNKRGKPEHILSLSMKGFKAHTGSARLKSRWEAQSVDSYFVEHELLVNWSLIHLIQVERTIPQLSVHYLTRHFSTVDIGTPSETIFQIKLPKENGDLGFVPDSVFIISDSESKKSLLFFLEVDMGTETIASPKRGPKDIRQKILNYQYLFRSGRYKRYARYFNCRLNGFRLLFITYSTARLRALSRLVVSMPPSDFIWLTNRNRMFLSGLASNIWARGAQLEKQLQSILGKKVSKKAISSND